MKKLLPLILFCTLLCGCGRKDIPDDCHLSPTESVVGPMTVSDGFGGSMQTVPLNLQAVQGLRLFGGNILLFSGETVTTLTLLDPDTLDVIASLSLSFFLGNEDPSLVLHPTGHLSLYDPDRKETLLLDRQLHTLGTIPAPGSLSGVPILSPDETVLFYCTPTHVRAWELESGIRRRVKEMAFSSQALTGVHMDGAVLECRIADDTQTQTLFLSSEDGRLLHQGADILSLETDGNGFFAQIRAGTYTIPVFGTSPDVPIMLFPGEDRTQTFYLPNQMAAVIAFRRGSNLQLDYCRLSTGERTHSLSMEPFHVPLSVEAVHQRMLLLLSVDSRTEQFQLVFWALGDDMPEGSGFPTVSYRAEDNPDTAGLSQCRRKAAELEMQYGIRICCWDDTPAAASGEWQPEHHVPILQRELTLLEANLARYPEDMLRKTAEHFSSVNLCLVRSVSGEGPHCTPFLDGSDACIFIPTGYRGEQALYHRLFHLMEVHIFGNSNAFDDWGNLNPAGFHYDYDYRANALRDSGVYLFQNNRSFVDTFSMSYPKEDRARIMEYAMLPGQDSLFLPPAMQQKLQKLCGGIRDAYALEDREESFLWEQYLD